MIIDLKSPTFDNINVAWGDFAIMPDAFQMRYLIRIIATKGFLKKL